LDDPKISNSILPDRASFVIAPFPPRQPVINTPPPKIRNTQKKNVIELSGTEDNVFCFFLLNRRDERPQQKGVRVGGCAIFAFQLTDSAPVYLVGYVPNR
jgi:hypothetical protein